MSNRIALAHLVVQALAKQRSALAHTPVNWKVFEFARERWNFMVNRDIAAQMVGRSMVNGMAGATIG